jgi:NADPH-dependent curcumin reductase CurA
MNENRRVLLRQRPNGLPLAEDFAVVSEEKPQPRDDDILVRNIYCSLAPAMRRWMDAESYAGPIPLNGPVRCVCLGRVVESGNAAFRPGDYVMALGAVEEYSIVRADPWTLRIEPDGVSLSQHLSLLGLNAMTAYFGLLEIGRPRPGETVLISGAAGSVGSMVGQIAKIKGCRTVGIAGGARKCARLLEEFAFDAAVDYHDKDLQQLTRAISIACPEGVDVYFDNVGGVVLDAALAVINTGARLVECGMISEYNASGPVPGPSNLFQIIGKGATMQGFLGRQYLDRHAEAKAQIREWAAQGRIHAREHIEIGIDNFHSAFLRLFEGSNEGTLILQVGAPGQAHDSVQA